MNFLNPITQARKGFEKLQQKGRSFFSEFQQKLQAPKVEIAPRKTISSLAQRGAFGGGAQAMTKFAPYFFERLHGVQEMLPRYQQKAYTLTRELSEPELPERITQKFPQKFQSVARFGAGFLFGTPEERRKRRDEASKYSSLLSKAGREPEKLTREEIAWGRKYAKEQGSELGYRVGFAWSGVKPVQRELKAINLLKPEAQAKQWAKFTAKMPKYEESINIQRLGLSKKGEKALRSTINKIRPELQKAKGKTLSHDEVLRASKESPILERVSTRTEQKASQASLLKTRQTVTRISNKIGRGVKPTKGEMRTYLDNIRVINSQATEKGRALEALKISADDAPAVEKIMGDVMKVADDTDEVLRASEGVDFGNMKQVTEFYRKFVQPKTSEILDEWRYNSMLSSPRTQMRNIFHNIQQTFLTRPATLVGEEGLGAGFQYYKGALKGIPSAIDDFLKTMRGEMPIEKPDIKRIPTGKLPRGMNIPSRMMEAGDRFFSKLISEGELARGATKKQASELAEYSLFRAGIDKKAGQGVLLQKIDDLTGWLYKMPKEARWAVPFIRTPMNIAKQWIEYSPAGVLTTVGATNKKAQLWKSLMGSVATFIGWQLVEADRVTLSSPAGEKQKRLFYSAGKRPFSVKLGNRWYPMWFFSNFALCFALPAIVKKYSEGEDLSGDQMDKLSMAVGDSLKFVFGQTPFAGLNVFVQTLRGDVDFGVLRNLGFVSGQVLPFGGLMRYLATAVDPVYRKPKGFSDQIMKDLPFLSKRLPAYTEIGGEPARRDISAYIAPYTIGRAKPQLEDNYRVVNELKTINRVLDQGKIPTKSNPALTITMLAEYVNSEVNKVEKSKRVQTLKDLKGKGYISPQVADKLLLLQRLEKEGLSRKDRELILLSGEYLALRILERLDDFKKEKNRTKHLKLLREIGLIDQDVAKFMIEIKKIQKEKELKSEAPKKKELSSQIDYTKQQIVKSLQRQGKTRPQIVTTLARQKWTLDDINKYISA